MKLYEIDEMIMQAFEQAVDPETGEIVNEPHMRHWTASRKPETRRLRTCCSGSRIWSAMPRLKKEKMAFAERQQQAEKRAESLKKWVAMALNGEKFSTSKVSVSWRSSEAVEYVGNVTDLPAEYIKVKDPEVDKMALKKALKAGEVIEGASLIKRQNMQIK